MNADSYGQRAALSDEDKFLVKMLISPLKSPHTDIPHLKWGHRFAPLDANCVNVFQISERSYILYSF